MSYETDSGVVKMGIFFSDYLEGVPNSKIFTLSQAIYDSLNREIKKILDSEEAVISKLDKAQVKALHEALAEKDYNSVRQLIKENLVQGESELEESAGEVPEDVFKTMRQDPSYDFASNEKVAVKRSDGVITFGFVYLMIDDRIVVNLPEGLKSSKREDIWHF